MGKRKMTMKMMSMAIEKTAKVAATSTGDEDDDKNDAIKVFIWLEEVVVEFLNMNSCEIEILAICLQAQTIPSSASPFNAFESYQQFCATLSSNIYAIKLNIKVEI